MDLSAIPTDQADLAVEKIASLEQYQALATESAAQQRARRQTERLLSRPGHAFDVAGICYPCQRTTAFRVGWDYAYEVDGQLAPNWREHLVCPSCGLNNRMRATLHILDLYVGLSSNARIFLTEQVTQFHRHLRRRFSRLVGSEFLEDGTPPGGTNSAGVRHEDLTMLSFAQGEFDALLSFDVLEHLPDYRHALAECHRVLKPGGHFVLSVPFRLAVARNLVRAVLEADGSTTLLEPAEYHGDPLRPGGCLAFYHFGWELLRDLQHAGFAEAAVIRYWSHSFGYLGADQSLIVAHKRP